MRQIIVATVTLIVITLASSALSLRNEWAGRCNAYVAYAHCVGGFERS
jgi:hypothetical protein